MKNFITEIIENDIKNNGEIVTHFLQNQMVICILVMLNQSV